MVESSQHGATPRASLHTSFPASSGQNAGPSTPATSFRLTGILEKRGFPPWVTVILGLLVAFLLFQGISTFSALALVLIKGGSLTDLLTNLGTFLDENAHELILGNTIGQVFGLLIPALLFARFHTTSTRAFLRIQPVDFRLVILSIVGLVALIPLVQWVGVLSDGLPWPESIRAFEKSQMDLIEKILTKDFSLAFTVSMLALTPAVCEEILFRGYIQRQAERAWGVWGGLIFTGVAFGLYHLRLTQAIPLGLLGTYLAWLTWRSGSLIPAMIVHLANNSFAAIAGKMTLTGQDTAVDAPLFEVPWIIGLLSVVVLAAVTVVFHRVASARQQT